MATLQSGDEATSSGLPPAPESGPSGALRSLARFVSRYDARIVERIGLAAFRAS